MTTWGGIVRIKESLRGSAKRQLCELEKKEGKDPPATAPLCYRFGSKETGSNLGALAASAGTVRRRKVGGKRKSDPSKHRISNGMPERPETTRARVGLFRRGGRARRKRER